MEELLPKQVCRFCDEGVPTHICFSCVDIQNENDSENNGVLICQTCMTSFHCKGMFLTHFTSSLASIDKTQSMISEVKKINNFVSASTSQEILKLNVKRSLLKIRNDEASDFVHMKLMSVWNAFVDQLTAKEKEINNEIQDQVQKLCKKADVQREKIKEIATKSANDCEVLLSKLTAQNRSVSEEDLKEENHQFEKLCELKEETEKILANSLPSIGPYVDIDLGDIHESGLKWMNNIKLKEIQFHAADTLQNNKEIVTELYTILSDETEYVVPSSFVSQTMLNPRHNWISIPQPSVAKHGVWICHALEYYLLQASEQKLLESIPESDIPQIAQNSTLIAVKYREQTKMHRCFITIPGDGRSKQRRRKDLDVQLQLVDNWENPPMKPVPASKLLFFALDDLAQSFPYFCMNVVVETEADQPEKVKEWTPLVRKKLSKQLDSKQNMKVKMERPLPFKTGDRFLTWLVDLTLGDVSLKTLFTEEEKEIEKPKLCQDVRVLRGDDIPVVRETIKPEDEITVPLSENSGHPPTTDAPQSTGTEEKSSWDEKANNVSPCEVVCGVLVDLSEEVGLSSSAGDGCLDGKCSDGGKADNLNSFKEGELGEIKAVEENDGSVQHVGALQAASIEERKEHLANVQRELKKILIAKDTNDDPQQSQSLLDDNTDHISAEMQELQPTLKPATDCNNNASNEKAAENEEDPVNDIKFNAPSDFSLDDDEVHQHATADMTGDLDEYTPECSSLCVADNQHIDTNWQATTTKQHHALSANASQFQMPRHHDPTQVGGVSLKEPAGPRVYMAPPGVGPDLSFGMPMIRLPAEVWAQDIEWTSSERASLRYVTLIIFGENSTEFINSGIIGEPPISIRKYWSGLIREQQWLWSLLPPPIYYQCIDYEMQRFPDLRNEFCRYCIPFNINQLVQRLGPQMPVYLQNFPELKGVLDIINNHRAQSQWRQVVAKNDNIVVSVSSACDPSKIQPPGTAMSPPGKEESPNQSGSAELTRHSPASLPELSRYSYRKMPGQSNTVLSENIPIILKRSKSEGKMQDLTIKRTISNKSDTGNESSSTISHSGERECDWIEDEEEFAITPPAMSSEPKTSGSHARGDRGDGRGQQCYNCGAFSHKRGQCPHGPRQEKNSNYARKTNRFPRGRRQEHGDYTERDHRRNKR
uniref:Uncharacterized protein LOC100180335 n=1 Tax=Phallusia mammillata TaxID=59560 RepID=A0A6F9DH94_9ASCI|nr:uncharacterized protein LOC100180335 [Phallusia mammillata]